MRLIHRFAVALVLAVWGAVPASPGELRFDAVDVPTTPHEQAVLRATAGATIDGRRIPLAFMPLLRGGQRLGSGMFAGLVDRDRRPILGEDGKPAAGQSPDFTSLIPGRGTLWAVSHIEDLPGALYLSRLVQDRRSGTLSAVATRPLDLGFMGGIYTPCAGQVTPWQTHLGGEEYPPDARAFEATLAGGDARTLSRWVKRALPYHGLAAGNADLDEVGRRFRPYRYGYPFEVRVKGWQNVTVERHYSMGRFSHELAAVMPDRRTAYMSDDGENTGFFMFVADRPGDLTSGRLYAARWDQTSPPGDPVATARLTWVDLGHARSRDVARSIERGLAFSHLFETADMSEEGACPAGFGAVNFVGDIARRSGECLKVRPGRDMLASRLETRRYAALKGATTEFNKAEGLTFDPARKRLYAAMSSVDRGMADFGDKGRPSTRFDRGGPNHIRLGYNPCGVVLGLDLARDPAIGSDYVATSAFPVLSGRPAVDGGDPRNRCALDGIANPDNITFIPEHDILIVAEDTDEGHLNNAVWAYDVGRASLTRIMTVAQGAEASGVYWYPDINGFGYLSAIMQHPFADGRTKSPSGIADAKTPVVGIIGPFPVAKRAPRN